MATFDFAGGGTQVRSSNVATRADGSTTSFTFDETEGAQTVKFTLSVTDSAPTEYVVSHNGAAGRINLSNGSPADGTDLYTLEFFDTATPTKNLLTGGTNGNVTVKMAGTVFGTWKVSFVGTKGTETKVFTSLQVAPSAVAATSVTGNISKIVFSSGTAFALLQIDQLNADVACFMPGTLIATPDGQTAVEDLREGDRVVAADGRAVPVTWIGEQVFDPRLAHPAKINPICIRAGALGQGLPARDLFVSADHGIAVDGHLINAGALVNGRSIYQVPKMPLEPFTYYHIETEAHELLLAEGCAAESFVDYVGRDAFDNGDEAGDAVIPEMDLPRIASARLVPDRVRAFLAERADAIGLRAA